jgi:hypothetical protein
MPHKVSKMSKTSQRIFFEGHTPSRLERGLLDNTMLRVAHLCRGMAR